VPAPAGGAAFVATTVAVPPLEALPTRPVLVFAYPGGGYSREYFDLRVPGHGDAYSMLAAMAANGIVGVASDHLGTGESSPRPSDGRSGTSSIVAANHAAAEIVMERLRAGRLRAALPAVNPGLVVGLGHSMGSGLVTTQQEAFADFDALVLLGRSVGATEVPAPPTAEDRRAAWKALALQYAEIEASAEVVAGGLRQARLTPWQRFLYHWDDVPDDVVAFGETILTTFPVDVARELGGPDGRNVRAAAVVDVPILLGFGERDVSRSPADEAGNYPSARSVDVTVVPRSGHAHNFATTRSTLWASIVDWINRRVQGDR
jgi:alpha-beta hydrolase superfamily lysophospholipase